MILQSILYPCDICEQKEIYYQCEKEIVQNEEMLDIPADSRVSFFSYMNAFDIDAWKKYTSVSKVQLVFVVTGKGNIEICCRTKEKDYLLAEQKFDISDKVWKEFVFDIDLASQAGFCYFKITAGSNVQIKDARFETHESAKQAVQIALDICTYHRNEDIKRNIAQLRKSRFFNQGDELFHKLNIVVVDNGSELEKIEEDYIRLVHNPNTGGSGGFKRGLDEIRRSKIEISHIVFMDDDVEFLIESLYRLYALLSYMRKEYQKEPVVGRMFRTDNRFIQYTAAEIWNKGDLKHIGLNADMTQEQEVLQSNCNIGAEYGGWWFCCYPMSFARDNDPLPFFLHCDDVEYGLRQGGTPIVLNGIQVWHETYEYRQSPVIAYYDTRNALIVNAMYGLLPEKEKVLEDWKKKITEQHVKKDFLKERMIILGLKDFLLGTTYLKKCNSEKKHKRLCGKKRMIKEKNSILWRFTEYMYLFEFEKRVRDYQVLK